MILASNIREFGEIVIRKGEKMPYPTRKTFVCR